MESELTALYVKREAALAAWDATAYNEIDAEIRARAAFIRAEINLGLRDDFIFSASVA